MSCFSRERQPLRSAMVNVRVSADEKKLLGRLARKLGLRGQSELVRMAIDCFLENDSDARQALGRDADAASVNAEGER